MGAAADARQRKSRAQARHVAWLSTLYRQGTSHHTAPGRGSCQVCAGMESRLAVVGAKPGAQEAEVSEFHASAAVGIPPTAASGSALGIVLAQVADLQLQVEALAHLLEDKKAGKEEEVVKTESGEGSAHPQVAGHGGPAGGDAQWRAAHDPYLDAGDMQAADEVGVQLGGVADSRPESPHAGLEPAGDHLRGGDTLEAVHSNGAEGWLPDAEHNSNGSLLENWEARSPSSGGHDSCQAADLDIHGSRHQGSEPPLHRMGLDEVQAQIEVILGFEVPTYEQHLRLQRLVRQEDQLLEHSASAVGD